MVRVWSDASLQMSLILAACSFLSLINVIRALDPNDCKMAERKTQDKPNAPIRSDVLTYYNYLQLDSILNANARLSKVHDEHLFITIHQAYELWFKQVLFELDGIRQTFSQENNELMHNRIVKMLDRVVKIMAVLVSQFVILETMPAIEFFDFREYLKPASGFQSLQFRLLELTMGVQHEEIPIYNKQPYTEIYPEDQAAQIKHALSQDSVLKIVEKWLENLPGMEQGGYDFGKQFKAAVRRWLDSMKVAAQAEADGEKRQCLLEKYTQQEEAMKAVLDETAYNGQLKAGLRHISHNAFLGAMMIFVYGDEPRFQQAFRILTLLMDLDEQIVKWRFHHVSMVHRMIGNKIIGTGGSSGYSYLTSTLKNDGSKVFVDLANMPTYFVPREFVPKMPADMKKRLQTFQD